MNQPSDTFLFLGNNLGVDFVNTVILNQGEAIDLLSDLSAFQAWARQAGVTLSPDWDDNSLPRIREFRDVLRELFLAAITQRPPADQALHLFNQYLQVYGVKYRLSVAPTDGSYQLDEADEPNSVGKLLGKIAYESASLLASAQARMLKRCGNQDCVLIFVDTSRSHKRRWCSMEVCGNRAKVATHYRNKHLH